MSSKHIRFISMGQQSGGNPWIFIILNALAALSTTQRNFAVATPLTEESLPHLCDSVYCPPAAEIVCPADSDVRESFIPPAAALIESRFGVTTAANDKTVTPRNTSTSTNTLPHDDLYIHCCVAPKCLCRTCHILDCHNEHEVVYELTPEAMDMPGKCCGSYECRAEPKCPEVRDTESYWLTNCQRCKCFGGERICHQSCDEGLKKSAAICNSKKMNRFFENGETWKYGCYECECVNGEEKCVMPFCRSVNCPHERQVLLKDSCCPICWPANITMPNAQDAEYDEAEPLLPVPEEEEHDIIGNYDEDDDDDEDEDVERNEKDNDNGNGNAEKNDDAAEELDDILPNILLNNFDDSGKPITQTRTTTKAILPIAATTPIAITAHNATSIAGPTANATISATVSATATATAGLLPCLTAPAPKATHELPATYQVYPEVVEVVRQTQQNDLLYAIIGCLAVAVVLLVAWNVHLRAKQRSYRPVSNFDDNFNKMPSSNIKKMNDYV